MKRTASVLMAIAVVTAACGDTADTTTTSTPLDEAEATTTQPTAAEPTTTVPEETTTTTTTTMPEAPPIDIVAVDPIPVTEFTFGAQEAASPDVSLTIVKNEFVVVLEFMDPLTANDCVIAGAGDADFTQSNDFFNVFTGGGCNPDFIAENFVRTDPLFMNDRTVVWPLGEIPHDPFNIFYTTNRNDAAGVQDQDRSRFGNPSVPISLSDISDVSGSEFIFLGGQGGVLRVGDWDVFDPPTSTTPGSCVPDDTTLCFLNDRFDVQMDWDDGSTSGQGMAVQMDDRGLFYFLDPNNFEFLIKVLDGCTFNNNFWVFSAATTNVEFTVTVTDTATGESHDYSNPLGDTFDAITDTQAFATCP